LSTEPDNTAANNSAAAETSAVRISGWQRLLVWPLGVIARLWTASLRFETSPESLRAITKRDTPAAFILWHNRLFIVGECFKRYRHGKTVHALVSASKDGAWLAAFFDTIGMRSVRGSSSFNARESVALLVDALRQGHDIGITPDGPRGPMYDFKGGGMIAARRARATVILLGAEYERAWRLRSWDGFYLPRPFSRVRVNCRVVTPDELASRAVSLETLAKRLRDLSPDNTSAAPPTNRDLNRA